VLIRRCAWHREFHRYPIVHGVATWGGLSIAFTDGLCRSCAARVRVDWLARAPSDVPLPRDGFAGTARLRQLGASVGLAALAAAVLPVVSIRLARRAATIRPARQRPPSRHSRGRRGPGE
jgi:hypothetical protein